MLQLSHWTSAVRLQSPIVQCRIPPVAPYRGRFGTPSSHLHLDTPLPLTVSHRQFAIRPSTMSRCPTPTCLLSLLPIAQRLSSPGFFLPAWWSWLLASPQGLASTSSLLSCRPRTSSRQLCLLLYWTWGTQRAPSTWCLGTCLLASPQTVVV